MAGSGVTASRGGTLIGTAVALMTSTVASAGLGFAFWVFAARFFEPAEVGTMSAGVATMTLLGAVAQLNLHSVFGRFLPTAGPHTRRLLLAGYAASAVTALGLATGFLALGMASGVLPDRTGVRLLFVTGVLATAIFMIQDGVLTALGRARSVPLKNVLASGAKLLLLPLFAAVLAGDGLLFAWALPIIAVMLAGNAWIFARLVPAHAARHPAADRVRPREVYGFASAEYANGVINNVVAFLPPLLVTNVLGGERGAYFYLPWVIGVSVTTLLWNIVSSFIVQASGGGDTTPPVARGRHHLPPGSHAQRSVQRAVSMVALVSGGGMVVLTVGATPMLSIFDGAYAAQGATALRLIGLSLPFTGIFILYGAFSVMEKRMWRMVGIQLAGAAAFLAGAWFGLRPFGLEAPATALLVSQAGVGLLLLPGLIGKYRAVGTPGKAPAWAAGEPTPARPGMVRASTWTELDRTPWFAPTRAAGGPLPTRAVDQLTPIRAVDELALNRAVGEPARGAVGDDRPVRSAGRPAWRSKPVRAVSWVDKDRTGTRRPDAVVLPTPGPASAGTTRADRRPAPAHRGR